MRPRSAGGALSAVLGAVSMSVIAGVLVTAAVTPVVALSGIGTSSAIGIFESLPDHIDPGQLAEPSTLYAMRGDEKVELATFYDQDRETVAFDQISQFVKDAAVAEEDPRFYTHGGVDVFSTGRAVLQNAVGKNISGASTISMQYVRNILIQEAYAIVDEDERKEAYDNAMRQDMDRKLKEMKLAISLEKQYDKDDILLGYLNISLFGRQIYGIESAAQYYYGKSAKDVTLAEAASLVAIVNNPSELQIDVPDNIERNQQRRDKILNSMLTHGKITQEQFDEAIATPVEPKITPRESGCDVAERNYGLGHFCDYVVSYIKQDASFGDNPTDREFKFSRGGYEIITTIDLDMQAAGLDAIHNTVPAVTEGIEPGAVGVSVEVGTGKVKAMAQNRPYSVEEDFVKNNPGLGYTGVNYAVDEEYGGSKGFQVGSTFKPVTLAQWLSDGHSLREVVNVNGRNVQESSFRASCLTDGVYGFGNFTFSNDNLGTRGNQQVLTAIAQSVNGGLVSMQQKMDLCDTFTTAQNLGIHRASDQAVWTQEEADQGLVDPSLVGEIKVPTLNKDLRDLSMVPSNVYGGVDEIAPITMASAFAAFAGDGTVCSPVPIESITGQDGEPVAFTDSECKSGISPEVAAGVAYALRYTVTNGLARHAASAIGVPHLAKTGTTDDVIDNWTVGASTKVATAVWVGNADPVCDAAGNCGRVSTSRFGGLMVADQTIWPAIMNVADAKYGGDEFPEPNEAAMRQTFVNVPDVTGKSYDEAVQTLTAAGFDATDGGEVDSSVSKGQVARTDPAAGTSVVMGSAISVYRSNGKAETIPDGLVGDTGNNARSKLKSAGFSNVSFACEGSGKANGKSDEVVSVDPSSGSEVRSDARVTLTLACG